MTTIAAVRADAVNLPLFLHVLGAMLLMGVLFTVGATTLMGWRRDGESAAFTRFGLRTLLVAAVPAYLLMRIGAQWTEAAANLPPQVEDSAWLGIGYVTADLGAILVLVSLVLAGLGLRRLRTGRGQGLARAVGVLSVVMLAAYVVAVWAMSAKPE